MIIYHGTDSRIISPLTSQQLGKNDTEIGAWFSTSINVSKDYGKIIHTYDASHLKLLRVQGDKFDFAAAYHFIRGMDVSVCMYRMKDENNVELLNQAFRGNVQIRGYEGVVLYGEHGEGFDVWLTKSGLRHLGKPISVNGNR